RETGARIEAVNLLRCGGAARLSKSKVERHEAATDVRKRPFEHELATFVAIETEVDEGAYEAGALRAAHHDRLGILDEHRVIAVVVILWRGLQKRGEIARRRKAQAKYEGILGAIDQFIKLAWLETSRITDLGRARREVASLRASAE